MLGTTGLYRPPLPRETRLAKAGEKMRQIRTSKPRVTWIQGPGPSDLFTLRDDAGVDARSPKGPSPCIR